MGEVMQLRLKPKHGFPSLSDSTWQAFKADNPEWAPHSLQSIGYIGTEGFHVLGAHLARAWDEDAVRLDFL